MKRAIISTLVLVSLTTASALNSLAAQEVAPAAQMQLSDSEIEMLENLETATELEKRQVAVYLAGIGATRYVEVMIRNGKISPNTQLKNTLLSAAAENGHLATTRMLVALGADVELKDKYQDTPLKSAARAGHLHIVHYLLSLGANPNATGKSGSTPLTGATYAGHFEIVKALLDGGATIQTNDHRWTLLHYAARYGHVDLVNYYIDKGIDIHERTSKGWTALALATHAGHSGTVKSLVALGADVDNPTNKKRSPLTIAASKGFVDIAETLIDAQANINLKDENGQSALWWAATQGQKRIAEMLLSRGAKAGSAVLLLAKQGERQALQTLIDSGMPLTTIANDKGMTGLHLAARYGRLAVVKLYLERGMDLHATDGKGYTALHRASGYGKTAVAQYLLDLGADPNNKGQPNHWTPVSLAARYGHIDILKMLHLKGGNLNNVTYKGWSPLMLGARGKHPLVVKYLLENNAEQSLRNHRRLSAIDIAIKSENAAVIELLSSAEPIQ